MEIYERSLMQVTHYFERLSLLQPTVFAAAAVAVCVCVFFLHMHDDVAALLLLARCCTQLNLHYEYLCCFHRCRTATVIVCQLDVYFMRLYTYCMYI